jgi:hypothetical protein
VCIVGFDTEGCRHTPIQITVLKTADFPQISRQGAAILDSTPVLSQARVLATEAVIACVHGAEVCAAHLPAHAAAAIIGMATLKL